MKWWRHLKKKQLANLFPFNKLLQGEEMGDGGRYASCAHTLST